MKFIFVDVSAQQGVQNFSRGCALFYKACALNHKGCAKNRSILHTVLK